MYACQLHCRCGGHVEELHDGVIYILTENYEIIFQGICNKCGEGVSTTRRIQDLFFLCPVDEKERGN